VSLASQAPRELTHPGTSDLAAYDLYLKARHEFNKFDEGPLRESIKLYNQAIERDPRFAQAWAGIASSWIVLADDYVAPRIAYPAAKKAAEQALTFDSTLAEAHAARASALFSYEWKLDEGRREANVALARDPHSFIGLLAVHGLLLATGKPDSALLMLKAAEETDPLSVVNALLLGRFYGIVGRPAEAIQEYERVIQLAPPMAPIAMIPMSEALVAEGRRAAADSAIVEVRKALGPGMDFLAAPAEATLGNRAQALKLVAKYEAVAAKQYVRPEIIAGIYVRLGDKERAFQWLDKALGERSPYLLALRIDHQWDPIRSDPRFEQLVKKVGLS
jgi:tetratricopeptide (TPR) repeat protein